MIDRKRKRVVIGSMNYDERSAWSIYRLLLGTDDEVQWVVTRADGTELVLAREPHSNWLLSLKMFLLAPVASEDLL